LVAWQRKKATGIRGQLALEKKLDAGMIGVRWPKRLASQMTGNVAK
jgi:hypothetical protein